MANPEAENPDLETRELSETFFADAFATRPDLPTTHPDISGYIALAEGKDASAAGYSWGRMLLFLAQLRQTFQRVGAMPLACLDVASSLPQFSVKQELYSMARSGVQARMLTGELFGSDALNQLKKGKKKQPELVPLAVELAKDDAGRSLIAAAVQEQLYQLTTGDKDTSAAGIATLADALTSNMEAQRYTYQAEPQYNTGASGKDYDFDGEKLDDNYITRLSQLQIPTADAVAARARLAHAREIGEPLDGTDIVLAKQTQHAGKRLATEYLRWQATYLAREIATNKRFQPARFFSMDMDDPQNIAIGSIINMPSEAKETKLFAHAIASLFDPNRHLRGNLFEPLQFPDNSLAYITCFDAWPLHFQTPNGQAQSAEEFVEVALTTLRHWYQKLAFGGEIIVFPWDVPSLVNSALLDQIKVMFDDEMGIGVGGGTYSRNTLMKWMSPSDRVTSEGISPIFRYDNQAFHSLIITKPNKSLANTMSRKSGAAVVALTEAQTQG